MYETLTDTCIKYNVSSHRVTSKLALVSVCKIEDKCVYLDVTCNHQYVFVSLFPNSIEIE